MIQFVSVPSVLDMGVVCSAPMFATVKFACDLLNCISNNLLETDFFIIFTELAR